MRKFVLLAALLAMLLVAALPALAADNRGDGDRNNNNHRDNNNNRNNNNGGAGGGGGGGIAQESEQETESGDVDQSFTVTNEGDNSNQCAGIQGVANTGNAQNQIDLIQYASEADDFEFDEVGSSLDVSPTNTTECNQEVNQAASASGK
jgi:hypothetical protein